MNLSLAYTLVLAAAFLLLFLIAEVLFWKFNVKVETTRKMVHLGSGLISLSFPYLINDTLFVFILCSSFIGILLLSFKYKFLKSVNNVDRKTHGSILFPIIVFVCYLAFVESDSILFYYLPLLILSISDPLAALVGKRFPLGKYHLFGGTKTLMGSGAFLISAFVCSIFSMTLIAGMDMEKALEYSIYLALGTTVVEAILIKGFDNFFIPISCMSILLILELNQFNF